MGGPVLLAVGIVRARMILDRKVSRIPEVAAFISDIDVDVIPLPHVRAFKHHSYGYPAEEGSVLMIKLSTAYYISVWREVYRLGSGVVPRSHWSFFKKRRAALG